jgi:cytidylate kinase
VEQVLIFPKIIAVDGPAASGKSTLAEKLARRLGYLYFDTGVMYRAVTLIALESDVDVINERQITTLAENILIDVLPPSIDDGRGYDVIAEGRDVTWAIRKPEVDANVSIVSAYPGVRKALSAQQRRIGLRGEVVMVGRDIGTVVLPDADLKIYLDASVEERARRRYEERIARGEQVTYDEILDAMRTRDLLDSTRDIAPLCAAEDAIVLDSDDWDANQVLDAVMKLLAGEGVDK